MSDLVRVVKKDPDDPKKEKNIFDIIFPIGVSSEDIKDIIEELIGKDVLQDPENALAGVGERLRILGILNKIGINVRTPGIETDVSKAFGQALRKTTESSE